MTAGLTQGQGKVQEGHGEELQAQASPSQMLVFKVNMHGHPSSLTEVKCSPSLGASLGSHGCITVQCSGEIVKSVL